MTMPEHRPCGCVWQGAELVETCRVARRIQVQMRVFRRTGQTQIPGWQRLQRELQQDHSSSPLSLFPLANEEPDS